MNTLPLPPREVAVRALLLASHDYRTAYEAWSRSGSPTHQQAVEAAALRVDRARQEASEAERLVRGLLDGA